MSGAEYDMGCPVIEVSSSKGPSRIRASLPLPEDGNRFSFQNVVFCS
jgi:hypothetical protein